MNNEQGFTLIELLTIIAIIGILSGLGITSFFVYKSDAAYAVSEQLVSDGINGFEAAIVEPDKVLPLVSNVTQNVPGAFIDSSAKSVFPGVVIPRKLKVVVSYDPACEDASCEQASMDASPCYAKEHIRWIRYGDGLDVRLEHLAGGGC